MKENKVIFKKYKPLKIIGDGTLGKIYSTIRLEDKSVFAMKTEKRNTKNKMLETEAYFLILLQGFGIPKLITFGSFIPIMKFSGLTSRYTIFFE